MTIYILIGVLILIFFLLMAVKGLENREKPQDSALKQRAIFNLNEQLTYTRLQEILPQHIILAHVSFDALLTTKFSRTRHKYRNMMADFVVLDANHQVVAIVALDDLLMLKRSRNAQYQDELLRLAGYKVLRYEDVPEYHELREAFGQSPSSYADLEDLDTALKKYDFLAHSVRHKVKVLG
ncbi:MULTISPECIES: DUF2726 domain-containing protein [unclassified Acinetobacter]|uniref:DUF2726 domain-containing protein n=1 Tax=unclassified Acinetobacter TaxID=196816 RepID=UPI0015D35078|nr:MULTISPECIES: DUF2726 domain-containing protein [unclassified Acinetobacter]